MQTIVKVRWHLMLFAALVATAGPLYAQGTEAGRFLAVVGDVRVGREGGQQRAAQREAQFYEGESIVTATGSLAQLRMSDGALMSVRGDTEIKLERFSYAGEQDRNASFLMSVLKGGLRTITGVIGRQNRERYRIATATVTIGVRGTDFEIVHVPPQAASQQVPAGTYDRVFQGVTSMQNKAGVMLLVSRDQTAFAALQGT
ncbi:MAG TPA: FecR family protein, partial [Burkholderiales bacterium]|nr:FecR family protein [Burkholderiales bacterium]